MPGCHGVEKKNPGQVRAAREQHAETFCDQAKNVLWEPTSKSCCVHGRNENSFAFTDALPRPPCEDGWCHKPEFRHKSPPGVGSSVSSASSASNAQQLHMLERAATHFRRREHPSGRWASSPQRKQKFQPHMHSTSHEIWVASIFLSTVVSRRRTAYLQSGNGHQRRKSPTTHALARHARRIRAKKGARPLHRKTAPAGFSIRQKCRHECTDAKPDTTLPESLPRSKSWCCRPAVFIGLCTGKKRLIYQPWIKYFKN